MPVVLVITAEQQLLRRTICWRWTPKKPQDRPGRRCDLPGADLVVLHHAASTDPPIRARAPAIQHPCRVATESRALQQSSADRALCEQVRYMIAAIQYGGRITDDLDQLLMDTYAAKFFHQARRVACAQTKDFQRCVDVAKLTVSASRSQPMLSQTSDMCLFCITDADRASDAHQGVLAPDYELHADAKAKVRYAVPMGTDIDVYRKAIEDLPAQEGPDIFGLNPNADLTFRSLQARAGPCANALLGV